MDFRSDEVTRPYTNKEISEGLREEGALYIKEFKYERQGIKELVKIFGDYSWKYPTYEVNGDKKMCNAAKQRSFSDLYRFVINYRSRTTVRTLKEAVKEHILEGNILPTHCGQIHRGVFLYRGYQMGIGHPKDGWKERLNKDTEFGMTVGEFYELKQ